MAVLLNKPVVCPVFIGRTAELTTLNLLIDRAKSGVGGVALLYSEAGIGKSRLVAEVKTYAPVQDFLLFQGNCFPTDISCPYAPMLDLAREAHDVLADQASRDQHGMAETLDLLGMASYVGSDLVQSVAYYAK